MPDIDFAFLADAAETVPGQKFHVLGGGVARIGGRRFPLRHPHLALVIGLFSYNGGLFWGLNADWEQVPDLHEFIEALEESFAELKQRAEAGSVKATVAAKAPRRASRPKAAAGRS